MNQNNHDDFRIERDSLGKVKVPANALFGAQTQRAVENFAISGIRFPRIAVQVLGAIKRAAAEVNKELGTLDAECAKYISLASREIAEGQWYGEFPVDIYQTGSGTSLNMNANEVIANRAMQLADRANASLDIHPNDHVNMGQSSNDVIPTMLHAAAFVLVHERLLPALRSAGEALRQREEEFHGIVKNGRTHLMDAMPIFLSDEIGAWADRCEHAAETIEGRLPSLSALAIGGTAVGSGVNTHPEFGARVAEKLSQVSGKFFTNAKNHFAAQAFLSPAKELSGALNAFAADLTKIAEDLRWMNSGPNGGLGEITLPALQPGSSIMPGKVNPVLCESVIQVCAQVMANDLAVSIGSSRGNFQLNVMLPLIAHNLLQSIELLANVLERFTTTTLALFTLNEDNMKSNAERNPVLVTALAPEIGYERAAEIAKRAAREGRSILEVAMDETDIGEERLAELLNPANIAKGNR